MQTCNPWRLHTSVNSRKLKWGKFLDFLTLGLNDESGQFDDQYSMGKYNCKHFKKSEG